ncbi:MAG: MBL fold metallo-hydrolase [Nitrospira sp. BO4]|jgi:glyoxylase-like metal-dependent hydrolase (beta-lactamase superfamily II)|nr:MBL fold metallo-hydrolase [Nitrospira sp. BO4]
MGMNESYLVTALLDVNDVQDVDDRAEARTYLISDRRSGMAAIIDSVLENIERDCKVIRDLGLTLLFALETHIHADHITGASLLKARTGAQIVYGGGAKGVVMGADRFLFDGETLSLGDTRIQGLATPGHTDSCISYVLPGAVFTGDSLFIGSNGRTDLQGGSAEKLFDSIRHNLFALPDDTIVYPGHDYNGRVSSTIGEEKRCNQRLNLSILKAAFIETMNARKVPPPAKMSIAIPANMRAGNI